MSGKEGRHNTTQDRPTRKKISRKKIETFLTREKSVWEERIAGTTWQEEPRLKQNTVPARTQHCLCSF
jgi:hypothetical protein